MNWFLTPFSLNDTVDRPHIDESPPGIEDAVQRTDTLFPR